MFGENKWFLGIKYQKGETKLFDTLYFFFHHIIKNLSYNYYLPLYLQFKLENKDYVVSRLREKVESQELKLRKLRAMRGQTELISKTNNNSLTNDLESIRRVFNEKEKELAMAVTKVCWFLVINQYVFYWFIYLIKQFLFYFYHILLLKISCSA